MDPHQMMAELFGQKRRKVLDRIPIPAKHVRRYYELVDAVAQAKKADHGWMRAGRDVWTFLGEILPITRGKDAQLDDDDVLRPAVIITGDKPGTPVIGKKGVVALREMPAEHLYRLLELYERQNDGPLAKYNLWSYIDSVTPLAREDERGRRLTYKLAFSNEWTGVVTMLDEEEEDE